MHIRLIRQRTLIYRVSVFQIYKFILDDFLRIVNKITELNTVFLSFLCSK